jgi:hypothetical protein
LLNTIASSVYREKLRLENLKHLNKHEKTLQWYAAKKVYLEKQDDVTSVTQAQLNLATKAEYGDERKIKDTEFGDLKTLGAETTSAEYKTELSEYKFPTPEEIATRETDIGGKFADLTELATKKQAVLEDDLKREEFREQLRQDNLHHEDEDREITRFIESGQRYLDTKEAVDSIADGTLNLVRLREYADEKKGLDTKFATLNLKGQALRDAKYQSDLSEYVLPAPDEVKARETKIQEAYTDMDTKYAAKKAVLVQPNTPCVSHEVGGVFCESQIVHSIYCFGLFLGG